MRNSIDDIEAKTKYKNALSSSSRKISAFPYPG
jgi:hypothetical protein